MKSWKVILLVFISVTCVSCFRIEQYSPIPKIEFIEFTLKDTLDGLQNRVLNGTLQFAFVDGDGDIGFDTIQPQKNTIFLEKYRFVAGVLTPVELILPLNYYVPKFTPVGNDKTLKGEIIVNDLNENYPFNGDTILYKFYIVDRAGNVSNVESTGNMIIY
ncbi:MAG: hypothetical protein PHP52_00650 [Bacteroidales bacterium]|nr:hypothetical protein [Bacteroidales bacterium]MDD4216320.1 hypothetical protein [Bacteroidales bacterium]MDY0140869.1 hypothetical protein [Bacteroidales bacterium]